MRDDFVVLRTVAPLLLGQRVSAVHQERCYDAQDVELGQGPLHLRLATGVVVCVDGETSTERLVARITTAVEPVTFVGEIDANTRGAMVDLNGALGIGVGASMEIVGVSLFADRFGVIAGVRFDGRRSFGFFCGGDECTFLADRVDDEVLREWGFVLSSRFVALDDATH